MCDARHTSISIGVKSDFNKSQPVNDNPGLWHLQTEFMVEAERLFGSRAQRQIIYQSSWDVDGLMLGIHPIKMGHLQS